MAKKRKAGDGTLRLRKDGRWEGRYVIGYDENGLPKTKNVLAKTKKECAEKLDALKAECGWIRSKTVKSDMRFGDLGGVLVRALLQTETQTHNAGKL